MKKIKHIMIVSIFLIGAISGITFYVMLERADGNDIVTTEDLANYIKDNNLSYEPYTIYKSDGSVDVIIPDGVYLVNNARITIECGVLKYLDNAVWTRIK